MGPCGNLVHFSRDFGTPERNLGTLGLDFLIGSETWERPRFDLTSLLDSPSYLSISYCRGRETPAIRTEGRQAGKKYPSNKGGGAAIVFNKHRFELIDSEFGVPLGWRLSGESSLPANWITNSIVSEESVLAPSTSHLEAPSNKRLYLT